MFHLQSDVIAKFEKIKTPNASLAFAHIFHEEQEMKFSFERFTIQGSNAAHERIEWLV